MNERAALDLLADAVGRAGDDAAVVNEHVLTTDMLHETTDFPPGTTRYTAGWRSVGASLSDVAAMGADATAAVAVYGAQTFDEAELRSFVEGALDVCEAVGAEYVGGDLDETAEFTVATSALGLTDDPVYRNGASPGDRLCVTGALGRSAAAVRAFREGDADRGNDLFRFTPRVPAGLALGPHATSMMDSSDGLARSVHQLSEASRCGFALDASTLPVADAVDEFATDAADRLEMACYYGEDFELVFTLPEEHLDAAREASPTPITVVGRAVDEDEGVTMDDDPLPDRGWTHGRD